MDQTTALELENLALRLENAAKDAVIQAKDHDAEAERARGDVSGVYHHWRREAQFRRGEDFGLRQAAGVVREMLKSASNGRTNVQG